VKIGKLGNVMKHISTFSHFPISTLLFPIFVGSKILTATAMILKEQLKELVERRDALRRYL
jgi:hypothetical protein